MRFYVTCTDRVSNPQPEGFAHKLDRRIYVPFSAENRSQIYEVFTIQCPHDKQIRTYRREDVEVEPTLGSSIIGTILGGIIGTLLGGPVGAIVGSGAGLVIGDSNDKEELRKVQRFYEV